MNLKNKKFIGLVLLVALPLILILILTAPMPQDQTYHLFADDHNLCGVPNFHNVISNIFFILFGMMGVIDYIKNRSRYTISWLALFVGIILIGPGSAYYHLNPNDSTLVWDRIPMTFGFMGLISSIFTDVFKIKNEKRFLICALALGLYTVMHWVWFDDLRIYLWLQFTTIIVLFYMAIVYRNSHLSMTHLIFAVAFYIGAKITEVKDVSIYNALNYSGHSIKHILAAIAVLSLILMKRNYVHHQD